MLLTCYNIDKVISYHQHETKRDDAGGGREVAHEGGICVGVRERCLQLALPGDLVLLYHQRGVIKMGRKEGREKG